MKTLEERFNNSLAITTNSEQAQQCAQICEEVSAEFGMWLNENCYRLAKTKDEWQLHPSIYQQEESGKRVYRNVYTTKELFQLFINQK